MRVLRRIDADGSILIGKRPIPMRALAGRLRKAKRVRRAHPVERIKDLNAHIGEIGVGHHARAFSIGDGMPGVK